MRMLPAIAGATLAALLITSAQAQVYRCTTDGNTTYSDIPCAIDADTINAHPATGRASPQAAAAARERAQRSAPEQVQPERTAPRGAAIGDTDASKRASDRCKQIAKDRATAEHWAREFRYRENIQREQAKADHWKERDFFECGRL